MHTIFYPWSICDHEVHTLKLATTVGGDSLSTPKVGARKGIMEIPPRKRPGTGEAGRPKSEVPSFRAGTRELQKAAAPSLSELQIAT